MSEYAQWKDGEIERSGHWKRIQDNLLLSLVKKILSCSPSKRYSIAQIKNHLWFKKKFKDSGKEPSPNTVVFELLPPFFVDFCTNHPYFHDDDAIHVGSSRRTTYKRRFRIRYYCDSGKRSIFISPGSDWYLVWRPLQRKNH